ncbi:MAG: TIGR01440 family protein [Lachnospiraceae bacterium]|nr:TIGR01440 family protein [Robinsoniella sp.]MDY3766678.1 TIGR01440 family protein [Lachnospiraceae bacterium]
MMETIKKTAEEAAEELLCAAGLEAGEILVVGCSTSEVAGQKIGTFSNKDLGAAIFEGIHQATERHGVYLAAQCCEHLNRALILEKEAAKKYGFEVVNVVPQPKAGGSFATAAYAGLKDAVAVEEIKAHAGMDIGDTLIGMHLKRVAVPVRISHRKLGAANLVCARTRPKYIGGERAIYLKA